MVRSKYAILDYTQCQVIIERREQAEVATTRRMARKASRRKTPKGKPAIAPIRSRRGRCPEKMVQPDLDQKVREGWLKVLGLRGLREATGLSHLKQNERDNQTIAALRECLAAGDFEGAGQHQLRLIRDYGHYIATLVGLHTPKQASRATRVLRISVMRAIERYQKKDATRKRCRRYDPIDRYLQEDLLVEAITALLTAARQYKVGKGVPFSVMARGRIRKAIVDYLKREQMIGKYWQTAQERALGEYYHPNYYRDERTGTLKKRGSGKFYRDRETGELMEEPRYIPDSKAVDRYRQHARTTGGLPLALLKDGLEAAVCKAVDDYLDGYTFREIAERDGVSERTARRAWEKAKEKLREIFQNGCPLLGTSIDLVY
jgi:RNA polymerase sigma factor (sigma-70 family)